MEYLKLVYYVACSYQNSFHTEYTFVVQGKKGILKPDYDFNIQLSFSLKFIKFSITEVYLGIYTSV
jgi:hypothetical protein